jgi:energy-coupling factor transporter ATP-binding protein EcfA2
MSEQFQDYLSAIVLHYAKDDRFYTPTDTLLPLVRSVERQGKEDQEKRVEQFPVLEGLRRYALGERREHVLLAGRPGSGKSTALRQLVVALAADGLVPVLVQLKGDRTVPELIKAEFRRAKVKVEIDQIEDWLLADRLVLLLDGVNEIPNDDLRRELAQFREENLTVPMIFTTRDLSLGGDLGIGKRFEMKPLSPEQLKEFVGKRLGEQGAQLLGQLHSKLPELAETPLLLKMLCDVFDPETGKIPESKGELFQWFDNDYERIKKEIEYVPVSENFWDFKSEVLQHLAFSMIQTDVQKPTELWLTVPKQRAEDILEKWLRQREVVDAPTKAKVWLKDLRKYHLLQDAAKPGEIEFHHQLFQEYYAAEYLKIKLERHPEWLQKKSDEPYTYFQHFYLNYSKWTECVAIVLSLMENGKNAVDLVEQALDVDLILGARLTGIISSPTDLNVQEIQRKAWRKRLRGEIQLQPLSCTIEIITSRFLPKKIEEYLLDLALNTNINYSQNNNQEVDDDEKINALIGIIKTTTNYDTFRKVAHDLGNLHSERAVPVLLSFFPVLLEEPFEAEDLHLLLEIESALILIHSEKACPDLINFLQDRNLHSCTRAAAARCLGGIGCESAIKALTKASKDKDLDIRKSSIEALGNIGCKTSIYALEQAIFDVDTSVQLTAKLALAKLGVASKSTITQLINRLEACEYMFDGLISFIDNDGSEVLEEKVYCQYHEDVSWDAAEALKCLDASILPELKKSLLSKSEDGTPHLAAAISAITAIQDKCKFYNYEIYQQAQARDPDDRSSSQGTTINQFPNVTEVKIFEQVDHYHASSPREPPS